MFILFREIWLDKDRQFLLQGEIDQQDAAISVKSIPASGDCHKALTLCHPLRRLSLEYFEAMRLDAHFPNVVEISGDQF